MERWERRERKEQSRRNRMRKAGYSVILLARLIEDRVQKKRAARSSSTPRTAPRKD
jgi:hypothetical protein